MKIYLATDHAGFTLKETVKAYLQEQQYELEDCGAFEFDANDDYPDFVAKASKLVSENPGSFGIVFGGSGQGEAMVANKFKNVRCALFYAPSIPHGATDVSGTLSKDPFEMLRITRKHNDSNMLALGGRFLKDEEAKEAVKIFLTTQFSKEERHARRIEKMNIVQEMENFLMTQKKGE